MESTEVFYKNNDANWVSGYIRLGSYAFDFEAKVYEEGSCFGINEGRVSKLFVNERNENVCLISYDRGWDLKPQDGLSEVLLSIILREFE